MNRFMDAALDLNGPQKQLSRTGGEVINEIVG